MADVLSGRFQGRRIMRIGDQVHVAEGFIKSRDVSGEVLDYEQMDATMRGKDAAKAVGAGALILGPAFAPLALAGGLIGLNKKRISVIAWKDGSTSVLEIKDTDLHMKLVQLAATAKADMARDAAREAHNPRVSKTGKAKRIVGEDPTNEKIAVENPTKKCPMCAEEILAAARKCKHCGEYL